MVTGSRPGHGRPTAREHGVEDELGASHASAENPNEAKRWWDVTRAPAAIYGTIISASVLAASEDDDVVDIALGVLITLVIYWLAERWSVVIAGQLRGAPFTWRHARRTMRRGWSMVQASYGPLIVLIAAGLLGATPEIAVSLALATTLVVMVTLGALAGRKAKLSRWGVIGSAAFIGFLGALLIVLKAALH